MEDDFYGLSPNRTFTHDESQYDDQYKLRPDDLSQGNGLLNLLQERKIDTSSPAWEIGCGSGALTLGVTAKHSYPLFLVTDMSAAFLRIVRQKCQNLNLGAERISLAIYDSDNFYSPAPTEAFSLITLRATLHHVLHPEPFIREMSKMLVPGGALVFHEPCREGFVLMGLLSMMYEKYISSLSWRMQLKLKLAGQIKDIPLFRQCANNTWRMVLNSARNDIDKSEMEDKHVFLPEQVMAWGQKCGLDVEFIPNREFNLFSEPNTPLPDFCCRNFTISYLKHCMGFNDKFLESFENFAAPYLDYINELSLGNPPPAYFGIFICRKRHSSLS